MLEILEVCRYCVTGGPGLSVTPTIAADISLSHHVPTLVIILRSNLLGRKRLRRFLSPRQRTRMAEVHGWLHWTCHDILRQYVNQKFAPHDLILLQSHFEWCPACALQNWGNMRKLISIPCRGMAFWWSRRWSPLMLARSPKPKSQSPEARHRSLCESFEVCFFRCLGFRWAHLLYSPKSQILFSDCDKSNQNAKVGN